MFKSLIISIVISIFALIPYSSTVFAANSHLDAGNSDNSHVVNSHSSNEITKILNRYLLSHKKDELVTGIGASISFPHKEVQHYFAGKMSKKHNAKPVTVDDLFQIGSITKSFTSIIILQLASKGVLNIDQTIGDWLPEYTKWKNVKIRNLLNMTSGIPDYGSMKKIMKQITGNIHKQWSDKEIVDEVYASPKSTTGYDYSNTNYLIAGMIIEKATNSNYKDQIDQTIIQHYRLNNTFYFPYPKAISARRVHGYYYGKSVNSIKHGEDLTNANMSMAGAAGALVSNSDDLVKWVDLVFSGGLLPEAQQNSLLNNIVSMKTGKPIQETTLENPVGFSLGLVQAYDAKRGRYWFYQGETPAYRSVFMFNPCNNIIVTITVNSGAIEHVQDHLGKLLLSVYDQTLKENKQNQCVIKH